VVVPTWGGFNPIQVNLTECLLSDIAENAVSFPYQHGLEKGTILITKDAEGFRYEYRDLQDRLVRIERRDLERRIAPEHPIENHQYDEEGRARALFFTDAEGNLTYGLPGFAFQRTDFENSESGRLIVNRRHYDTSDQPMLLTTRYFREETVFQGESKPLRIRYFDTSEERVVADVDGITDVYEVRFYDLKGVSPIVVKTFFATNGEPIAKRRVSGQTEHILRFTTYYY
jgi:hypothetical protein